MTIGRHQMPQSLWPLNYNRRHPSGEEHSTVYQDELLLPLYPMDTRMPGFFDSLNQLDHLPIRTADTLLIFYVAEGQKKVDDILANVLSWSSLSQSFIQFLNSIGHLTEVEGHPGWTGSLETSYNCPFTISNHPQNRNIDNVPDQIDHCPDGFKYIIYYADALTELTCICPSKLSNFIANDNTGLANLNKGSRLCEINELTSTSNKPHLNVSNNRPSQSVIGETGADSTGGRVAIVWLESWDDGCLNQTLDNPMPELHYLTGKLFNCPVTIYIHPLNSGLFRIGVCRLDGRTFESGPLQTGLVLSQACLCSFVRRTVMNISQRRRLASDLFQPPHVRRSHELFKFAEANRKFTMSYNVNSYGSSKTNIVATADATSDILLKLFTQSVQG